MASENDPAGFFKSSGPETRRRFEMVQPTRLRTISHHVVLLDLDRISRVCCLNVCILTHIVDPCIQNFKR